MPLAESENVIAIPRQAVIAREAGRVVFTVAGGLAREKAVSLGADLGGRGIIRSGLTAGDSLVVVGQEYQQDNTQVTIANEATLNPGNWPKSPKSARSSPRW